MKALLPLLALLLAARAGAETPVLIAAAAREIDAHVQYLSDDEREGRGIGTKGLDAAARYIQAAMRRAGLAPAFTGQFVQRFTAEDGTELRNVAGLIEGEPGETHILVAAHYDHLGTGEVDGRPVVYNGADDNASGVAALLSLAQSMSGDRPRRRTIVFAAFSGEESGLLGSRHYVENPARALEALAAMINLDSIGRLRGDSLFVFGTGTADRLDSLVEGLNRKHRFVLRTRADGLEAGDHHAFFERGVPILHLFTGPHLDYHQPTDTADKIDAMGIARVTSFARDLAVYLADDAVVLSFVPPGAEKLAAAAPTRGRRTVTLGTIPDFAGGEGGVRVSGIVPGSPAEAAGIAPGDIIVGIDGTPVETLVDYSEILKAHDPGDEIEIHLERDGEPVRVRATLAKRR